jgi:membrane-associated phospholipid phosphatase
MQHLHPFALCASLFIPTALIGSWKYSRTVKQFWDELDKKTFITLNNIVKRFPQTRWITALCTTHRFDFFTDIIMLFTIYNAIQLDGPDNSRREGFIRFGSYAVITFILYKVVAYLMVTFIKPRRKSPTLVLGGYRLSKLDTSMNLKDSSPESFPGDHTAIVMLFSAYMMTFKSLYFSVLSVVFAVLCSIPRLISGAHWLTDALIGATSIVSIVLGIYYGTPLHHVSTKLLTNLYKTLFQ